jgi:hypothetical protein
MTALLGESTDYRVERRVLSSSDARPASFVELALSTRAAGIVSTGYRCKEQFRLCSVVEARKDLQIVTKP